MVSPVRVGLSCEMYGSGGGGGDGDSVDKVIHVSEMLVLRDELRMLIKTARERGIQVSEQADGLAALNVSAAAPSKGQCPDDEMTRSCVTTSSKVQDGEVISEVTVQGGEVIGEEVKVREESDGAGEQQQPQRQQQPQQPRPQQQQQDQVGPLGACDNRPEEQQQQQQSEVVEQLGHDVVGVELHESEVVVGLGDDGGIRAEQPEFLELGDGGGVLVERAGVVALVMEVQHEVMEAEQQGGTLTRMDAGGRWCWGGEGFPPFAPD